MTTEEIMTLAKKAGFITGEFHYADGGGYPVVQAISHVSCLNELERFAHLLLGQEREMCAVTCEAIGRAQAFKSGADRCVGAIRARCFRG